MNCNTTHYRANSSSVPGDPTLVVSASALAAKPKPKPAEVKRQADIRLFRTYLAFAGDEIVDYKRASARFLTGLNAATSVGTTDLRQTLAQWQTSVIEITGAADALAGVRGRLEGLSAPLTLSLANSRLAKSVGLLEEMYRGMASALTDGVSALTTLNATQMTAAMLRIRGATSLITDAGSRAKELQGQWRTAIHAIAGRLKVAVPAWAEGF